MLLDDVLARVGSGTTTVSDAHWLHWHIIGLQSRIDRAEGELKGVRDQLQSQLVSAFGKLEGLEIALRRAEAEAKDWREEIARVRDSMDVTISHAADVLIADAEEHGSPNFRTHTVNARPQVWEITVRRIDGKTPEQHIQELRDKLAAWDAWEHAWVFGGDVPYPGSPGVTDPRETLDDLERLALGVAVEGEEAEDG